METGEWIATQAALGRTLLITPELGVLDGKWRTVVAIAMLSREYRTADKLDLEKSKASADESETAMLDGPGSMRVQGGAGAPLGVADMNEASVAAVESWLYDALVTPGSAPAVGDPTAAAVKGIRSYGWRKASTRFGTRLVTSASIRRSTKADCFGCLLTLTLRS